MAEAYFGVTGFTSRSEVERVRSWLMSDAPLGRQVMIGVLVSQKSLLGLPLREEWAARYPAVDEIEAIWSLGEVSEPDLLKTIHFNSKNPNLADQLCELMRRVPGTQAIQLNIYAPIVSEVWNFHLEFPGVKLILQVSGRVLEGLDRPQDLTAYLDRYNGLAQYALLDPSGGVGQPFDERRLRLTLKATAWEALGMLPGVAGGLAADTTFDWIEPFLRSWPQLCWDAEGRLVQEGKLYIYHVLAYLNAGRRLLVAKG